MELSEASAGFLSVFPSTIPDLCFTLFLCFLFCCRKQSRVFGPSLGSNHQANLSPHSTLSYCLSHQHIQAYNVQALGVKCAWLLIQHGKSLLLLSINQQNISFPLFPKYEMSKSFLLQTNRIIFFF